MVSLPRFRIGRVPGPMPDSLAEGRSVGATGYEDAPIIENGTVATPLVGSTVEEDTVVEDREVAALDASGSAGYRRANGGTDFGEGSQESVFQPPETHRAPAELATTHRRWTVSGASVAGQAHIRKGLGCDDAFAYATVGDLVVAAVADGAGSVTQTSAWGSYTVCDHVVTTVLRPAFLDWLGEVRRGDETPEILMGWLFEQALGALRARARYTGQPLGELATTLAVAIATPELAIFAQIGDGVIALRGPDGVRTVLIEEKGEYANLTWFVQSRDAFTASFRVHTATEVTAFALSTDGMAYKVTDVASGAAFVPFFDGAWSATAANKLGEQEFAAWLDGISDDQTGDDKTVVLAVLPDSDDAPSAADSERRVQSRRPPAYVAEQSDQAGSEG